MERDNHHYGNDTLVVEEITEETIDIGSTCIDNRDTSQLQNKMKKKKFNLKSQKNKSV